MCENDPFAGYDGRLYRQKLLLFTLPILASSLLQHFYSIANSIVVGNFAQNGTLAQAAIVSQYLSAFAVLWILFSPKEEYKLRLQELDLDRRLAWNIIACDGKYFKEIYKNEK